METLKSLNPKISEQAHTDLKVFAASKGIGLVVFVENVLIEASKDNDFMNKVANKLKNQSK